MSTIIDLDPFVDHVPEFVQLLNTLTDTDGPIVVISTRSHTFMDSALSGIQEEGFGPDSLVLSAANGVAWRIAGGEWEFDAAAENARAALQMATQLAQTVGWHYSDEHHLVRIELVQRGALGQSVDERHVHSQMMMVLNPTIVSITKAPNSLLVRPKSAPALQDQLTEKYADWTSWKRIAGESAAPIWSGWDH